MQSKVKAKAQVKRSKKQQLARLLMSPFLEKLLSLRQQKHLTVLAYHSIRDIPDEYPFNPEIISAEPHEFRQQLAFIKKHFNVVSFAQLEQMIAEKGTIKPNTLIITFDDGYVDNHSHMLPILKEFDLPAIVYLATDFIDDKKLFWFDEVAFLFKKMPNQRVSFDDDGLILDVKTPDRELERRAFGQYLQQVSDIKRLQLIQRLREITDCQPTETEHQMVRPMTWDEIRELAQYKIEIGSHTKNHGFLDCMTAEEIKIQLQESKQRIEQELQQEVRYFSYPNGNFHHDVVKAVDQIYAYSVSYDHAIAPVQQVIDSPQLIPRVHVETDVDINLFKAMLILPEIFVRG